METLIKAMCNLASADMRAMSDYVFSGERGERDRLSAWWREAMCSRGRFVKEFTQGMLEVLETQRVLAMGQMERMSRDAGRMVEELAHNTERSVAIATRARKHPVDRRVFPLPIPSDRRGIAEGDRRSRAALLREPRAGT